MRKYLVIILLLLATIVRADCTGTTTGSMGAVASDTYTDILFFWRCEGLTLGADDYYGVGDNVADAGSSAAINTDAVKIGINGGDCPTANDFFQFTPTGLINLDNGRVGFWLYITTFVAGIDLLKVTDAAGYLLLDIADSGGGNGDYDIVFKWRDASTTRTALTSDSDLSSGTWYFIEAAWDIATDYREVFVDGVSKGSSAAAINTLAGDQWLWIGNNDTPAGDIYIDNVMISNDKTRNLYLLKDLTASPR